MSDPAVMPGAAVELARAKMAQRDNMIRAGGIKQGYDKAKAELQGEMAKAAANHAGQLEGQAKAHEAELKRVGRLIGKAAFREGGVLGIVFGMGIASALIAGTYWLSKDMLFTRTTVDRVQHSLEAGPVPSLSDSYQNAEPATGEPIRRAP